MLAFLIYRKILYNVGDSRFINKKEKEKPNLIAEICYRKAHFNYTKVKIMCFVNGFICVFKVS